jgi:hypothetical protein
LQFLLPDCRVDLAQRLADFIAVPLLSAQQHYQHDDHGYRHHYRQGNDKTPKIVHLTPLKKTCSTR